MLYLELLLLCAFSPFLLCSSAKVKPRAQQAAAGSEAFWEIHNVMLRAQTYPGARNAQIARPRNEASVPAGGAISESPFAAIKRTLLGTRGFYCDPGYGLCSSIYCCSTSSEKCCSLGCAPTDGTCCSDGGYCDKGDKCCGTFSCAPKDAECCNLDRYCEAGLHCVILNGIHGCCKDLSCSEFDYDYETLSPPSLTFTPISVTPISYTPISITPISITPISVTPISIPPVEITHYRYFTTTWIWYYYTFFITTIPPSTTIPTSSYVTTSTILSAYATDSIDADLTFLSLTDTVTHPAGITAPDYTSILNTPTSRTSSATSFTAGGESTSLASSVAVGNGGAKTVKHGSFGVLVVGGCLGIGIGLLAVWL